MRDAGLAFVFSARGSEWPGMGNLFPAAGPDVRQAIDRCDAFVRDRLRWSITDELDRSRDSGRMADESLVPTLAAIQIALCDGWHARGVVPSAVLGISGGEFAAAYAAGALTLDDTMAIACAV